MIPPHTIDATRLNPIVVIKNPPIIIIHPRIQTDSNRKRAMQFMVFPANFVPRLVESVWVPYFHLSSIEKELQFEWWLRFHGSIAGVVVLFVVLLLVHL